MGERDLALAKLRERYYAAALQGDAAGAAAALDEGMAEGASLLDLHTAVIAPALELVGEMWEKGKLSVADEHIATAITLAQLQRLRNAQRPRPRLQLRAVVTTPEGELHMVAARMLADLLDLDGWDVRFLGASTPAADLVDYTQRTSPDLVAFSVTLRDNLAPLRAAAKKFHRLQDRPRLLAGGAAFAGETDFARRHPEVNLVGDLGAALRAARRLAGLPEEENVLDVHLRALGERILKLRKARGWSQQDLAERADLDRTYIGAVERGRQNVTLGAVAKIAGALGVDLERLLIAAG